MEEGGRGEGKGRREGGREGKEGGGRGGKEGGGRGGRAGGTIISIADIRTNMNI